MSPVIIFIPSSLYRKKSGNLYGVVKKYHKENVNNFYILDHKSTDANYETLDKKEQRVVGYFNKDMDSLVTSSESEVRNWLSLGLKYDEFVLQGVISDGEVLNMDTTSHVISIVYDYQMFVESELLLQSYESSSSEYVDYFKELASHIKDNNLQHYEERTAFLFHKTLNFVINTVAYVVHILLNVIIFMYPVLKYSSLGLQFHTFLESVYWALRSSTSSTKMTLKVGNFIVATIVDVCTGVLLLYWFLMFVDTSAPSQLLLGTAEVVVNTLKELLKWVMGIPAGLKLNFAFNNMLGKFFMYHINLWWTFLVVAKPVLELTFHIFLCFGRLGLTFQAAILADLLAIASFHVYCIYVYAARLYNLQVSGLVALWRLFLGRKRNPLRGRVDSCKYSPDQLFIGTLAFTILLFLLPTTFMYYFVFTILRLLTVGLGGLLTRIRLLLQTLPLYASLLWMMRSKTISKSLHLTVKPQGKAGSLILSASPVADSWWTTVQCCVPEPVKPPPRVEWATLLKNVATGHLIYPV